MRGLTGKRALVTGAGGAIGRAIAVRLAEEGAVVGVLDKNGEAAAETVRQVAGAGGRAVALTADITDVGAVQAAVTAFEAEVGPTDVLVNNAGWDRFQNFLDTDPADWEPLIAINLRGPLNMHHLVVPQMAQRGSGRVVAPANIARLACRSRRRRLLRVPRSPGGRSG